NFETVLSELKPVLENEDIRKVVFDSKALKHILYKYGVSLNGVEFDCILARYLINSIAKSSVGIGEVINECGLELDNLAYALILIKNKYYAKLENMDLLPLYFDIELPLVDVLFDMEIEGFKVDKKELNNLEEKYRNEIVELEKVIYEILGKKINLSSPKQLGEVLFDELDINIPSNKKKSTSIEILNEIAYKHPVVPLIIRWRTITKLYSTYILGFQNILDNNDKIHTIFNQALTSTGRLSSSEPNLQNIPVRTEEGKSLRKVFITSHENGLICSADYSQIELRLLANFSGDEKMINSFNNGVDIHRLTASEIFNIPLELVDENRRRDAKAINFGIVYGISDFGLSQNIGISRKEANKFIKLYFERYPKIEEYMNNNVSIAHEKGYIKTLFGRIRPIPEIYSSNYNLRTFGERVAMNMPLQGSASDIIKLAMIRIFNEFKNRGLKSKLIVQVHDELVVDVYPGELEQVKEILQSGMEKVVDLQVKLLVNISSGKTWYDAK
ncbi:MAG: DNA polymerase, partial [Christensenellales bacterium]